MNVDGDKSKRPETLWSQIRRGHWDTLCNRTHRTVWTAGRTVRGHRRRGYLSCVMLAGSPWKRVENWATDNNTRVTGKFKWKFTGPNPGCVRKNERREIIETTNRKLPKSFVAERSQEDVVGSRNRGQRMVGFVSYEKAHCSMIRMEWEDSCD